MISTSLTAIVLATVLIVTSAEAGQILTLDFLSEGTAVEEYVEEGVTVLAIPRTSNPPPAFSSVHYHMWADYFDFGVTSGRFLTVSPEDNGAAEFSLSGAPFDLLSADISTLSHAAVLEGFVDDVLRVSAIFPCCTFQFNTFTFADPAWRGLTSLVFDVDFSGTGIGVSIDNLSLHIPLPPSWMLFGGVAVLIVTAYQLGLGNCSRSTSGQDG
jgi:hypothetical protein